MDSEHLIHKKKVGIGRFILTQQFKYRSNWSTVYR